MTMTLPGHRCGRSLTAAVLGTVGVLLSFVGGLFALGNRAVFQADFFADHVAASLSDPRVASYVAGKITDAVIAESADLITVRPLIEVTAEAVVASPPFQAVVRASARRSHQLLTTSGGREVLLSVTDFGVILRQSLATRPDLAARIPDGAVAVIGELEGSRLMQLSASFVRLDQRFDVRPRILFWLGMVLLAASVLAANRHDAALLRAGVALIVVTLLVLAILEVGEMLPERLVEDPALGRAIAGVWSTFAGGLWPRVLLLGGIGLLLAAAGTAFLEVMHLAAIRNRLHTVLVAPTGNRWLRLARGLAMATAGWLTIQHPLMAARILVIVTGGVLTFIGLRELCRLAVDPAAKLARKMEELEADAPGRRRGGRLLIAAVGAVAIFGVAALLARAPLPDGVRLPVSGCNGLDELCDRRLDEVVFPGTHNSMAAADVPGWMFPNQQLGVRRQLDDGIRAFMLDVLPGIPVGGAVKTDFDEAELVREKLEPALGAEGFEAALRIRGRLLGGDPRDRELYLCHGLCELGAIRLVPVLREFREFLILHPREVVIIIIEDAVPAAEVAAAFTESRLVDLVYRGPVTAPWPTLGEMADSGGRVLVLAENDSEGVPWYHPAWNVFQETPYHFESTDALSNEPNRGGTAGSLLLMNHWITTPPANLPSNAQVINAREVLEARVEQCRQQRGKVPNVIAVDFYRTGDLVDVVRDLNRSAPGP